MVKAKIYLFGRLVVSTKCDQKKCEVYVGHKQIY